MLKISDRELQDIITKWGVVLDDKMPFDEKIKILKRLLKHDGYEVEEEKSLIERFDSFQADVIEIERCLYVRKGDYCKLYELAGMIKNDLLKQIDELKEKQELNKFRMTHAASKEIIDLLEIVAYPEKFIVNPIWNQEKAEFIRKQAQRILSKIE
jgi:hypothetical protein